MGKGKGIAAGGVVTCAVRITEVAGTTLSTICVRDSRSACSFAARLLLPNRPAAVARPPVSWKLPLTVPATGISALATCSTNGGAALVAAVAVLL